MEVSCEIRYSKFDTDLYQDYADDAEQECDDVLVDEIASSLASENLFGEPPRLKSDYSENKKKRTPRMEQKGC